MRGKIGGKRSVATYLGLASLFSSIFSYLVIQAGSLKAGRSVYVLGLMWSPAMAILLTVAILRRPASSLGWAWGPPRYRVLSYPIPVAYGGVASGVA